MKLKILILQSIPRASTGESVLRPHRKNLVVKAKAKSIWIIEKLCMETQVNDASELELLIKVFIVL